MVSCRTPLTVAAAVPNRSAVSLYVLPFAKKCILIASLFAGGSVALTCISIFSISYCTAKQVSVSLEYKNAQLGEMEDLVGYLHFIIYVSECCVVHSEVLDVQFVLQVQSIFGPGVLHVIEEIRAPVMFHTSLGIFANECSRPDQPREGGGQQHMMHEIPSPNA